MRTGMRDLIYLWQFQNRPRLAGLLAKLVLSRLPTSLRGIANEPGSGRSHYYGSHSDTMAQLGARGF